MRLLGDRPFGFVVRNAVRPANYRALLRAFRRYRRPISALRRYFRGSGSYPHRITVRTPAGAVTPKLESYHDLLTLNEVFCREDYRCDGSEQLVVDIGSNIGLSALYFLTEAPEAQCRLFEPDPRNVARLRANLAGYEDRYELEQVAVADREGSLPFAVDPFGRYGSLERSGGEQIEVRVRHIESVLEEALRDARAIDVLKVDTEGSEPDTIAAIPSELLRHVRRIYFESDAGGGVVPEGFSATVACDTVRLDNQRLQPGSGKPLR